MSGPNLPTNVDATYPGSTTDPTADIHQQHHDLLHRFANKFDIDAIPGDGQVYAYNAATGLFRPVAPTTGTAADLTGTPLVVSAATGGTGAYPARPATTRPVIFRGTTQPTSDGSTAGGGGLVVGLDEWRNWSSTSPGGAPSSGVTSVNGKTGSAVTLAASDVSAVATPTSSATTFVYVTVRCNLTTGVFPARSVLGLQSYHRVVWVGWLSPFAANAVYTGDGGQGVAIDEDEWEREPAP